MERDGAASEVCGRRVREACAGGGIGGGRCAGERARLQHCSFLVRLLYLALLRGLGHLARRPRRLLELSHLEVTCAELRLQLAHRVHARRQPLRRRRHRLLGDGGAAPLGRQLLLPLRQLKGEAGIGGNAGSEAGPAGVRGGCGPHTCNSLASCCDEAFATACSRATATSRASRRESEVDAICCSTAFSRASAAAARDDSRRSSSWSEGISTVRILWRRCSASVSVA